jgi:hypothetical protein
MLLCKNSSALQITPRLWLKNEISQQVSANLQYYQL